jgi:hypothetical protein
MAHGFGHVDSKRYCNLCGEKGGAKISCSHPGKKQCPVRMHPTCAREAGLEVAMDHPTVIMCFSHGRCEYAFRATLEDMIEFEKMRAGNDLKKSHTCMSLECATNILNAGIRVMRCLGWAWQWAEWWVHYGDNWEPLLEVGQKEGDMSREQLKYVESTPISRREDARKCRLAAFGAALRNRDYDQHAGDDHIPLQNALQAILSTKSLVGPLSKLEIDFFVEWLARVYRSKSPLLRFGVDKMRVNETWAEDSPVFHRDKSPKFELGSRKLPGKHLKKGSTFESVDEVDNYFENEENLRNLLPPHPSYEDEGIAAVATTSKKKAKTPKAPNSKTKSKSVNAKESQSSKERNRRKSPSESIGTNAEGASPEDYPDQEKPKRAASKISRRKSNKSVAVATEPSPIKEEEEVEEVEVTVIKPRRSLVRKVKTEQEPLSAADDQEMDETTVKPKRPVGRRASKSSKGKNQRKKSAEYLESDAEDASPDPEDDSEFEEPFERPKRSTTKSSRRAVAKEPSSAKEEEEGMDETAVKPKRSSGRRASKSSKGNIEKKKSPEFLASDTEDASPDPEDDSEFEAPFVKPKKSTTKSRRAAATKPTNYKEEDDEGMDETTVKPKRGRKASKLTRPRKGKKPPSENYASDTEDASPDPDDDSEFEEPIEKPKRSTKASRRKTKKAVVTKPSIVPKDENLLDDENMDISLTKPNKPAGRRSLSPKKLPRRKTNNSLSVAVETDPSAAAAAATDDNDPDANAKSKEEEAPLSLFDRIPKKRRKS